MCFNFGRNFLQCGYHLSWLADFHGVVNQICGPREKAIFIGEALTASTTLGATTIARLKPKPRMLTVAVQVALKP